MTDKFEKVFLVSCAKEKRLHAALAKDLYISPGFKKSRKYVERFGVPWFILSAKHGLLCPNQEIKYYDKSLKGIKKDEKQKWAQRVKLQMQNELPDAEEVIILAGKDYREYLLDYLGCRYKKICIPMEGLPNGKQLQWLKRQNDNPTDECPC